MPHKFATDLLTNRKRHKYDNTLQNQHFYKFKIVFTIAKKEENSKGTDKF